ncbi:hypothetical protein [Streptomyces sp. NPDC006691]|uniref:hypothetical protein n=1 Tax=Streptomyces sp. NPDC006691 TaxID=3364757 RepID=UPI0036866C98
MAAEASFLSLSTAHAENAPDCQAAGFTYSTDGGRTWRADSRLSMPHGTIQVEVDRPEANCSYPVTLASYDTEGPTWPTSGLQTFLGSATLTLDRKHPTATLDISAHMPKCYGQIDLYLGEEKYDGVHHPLPHYPSSPIADEAFLLTSWNGGHPCEPDPTNSPVPSPTADPTGTPTADPTPTGTAAPGPSTSPAPSSTVTGTPSATHTPRESSHAPSPSASVTVVPASAGGSGGNLAQTGGNGGRMLAYGIGAATLLTAGAGALVVARRRAIRR